MEWKDEAKNKVFNKLAFIGDKGQEYLRNIVFPFIDNLLAQQRQELEAEREKWLDGILPKKMKIYPGINSDHPATDMAYDSGFNKAIDQIKQNAKKNI